MTLKACDLRCSPEDKQAPWKSQLNAKLMAQRRPLWLPGSAQAHTELFTAHGHSPFHPPTYPVCPQQKTEPSVWGPESSLHIISCNNWQVGHWLLASNPPGAREKKKKSLDAPQLIFSLSLEKLQPFMTRNKLWAAAVLGKQETQNSLEGRGSFAHGQLGKEGAVVWPCSEKRGSSGLRLLLFLEMQIWRRKESCLMFSLSVWKSDHYLPRFHRP